MPPVSALPPFHSVAVVAAMLAAFVQSFPSLASLDQDATVETFATPLFPDLIPSPLVLGLVRLVFAALIFGTQALLVFGGEEHGWTQRTSYRPESKLVASPISVTGWKTLAPFTSCAWTLLGTSFLANGTVALLASCGREEVVSDRPWVLRAALILFETAAPTTMLVAAVVRYVIWPACLSSGGPDMTTQLRRRATLLMHNANVLMALSEVGLLGGLPVRRGDFAVAPLFGTMYVLFSWSMTRRWTEDGTPQFLYWFLDTTLGNATTVALLVLLVVLLVFFALFCVVDVLLESLRGGPITHAVAVVGLASLVCRFRD